MNNFPSDSLDWRHFFVFIKINSRPAGERKQITWPDIRGSRILMPRLEKFTCFDCILIIINQKYAFDCFGWKIIIASSKT